MDVDAVNADRTRVTARTTDGNTVRTHSLGAIDGTFPDYAHVIPDPTSAAVTLTFNARLLARVLDVVVAASGTRSRDPVPVTLAVPAADGTPLTVRGTTAAGQAMTFLIMPFYT